MMFSLLRRAPARACVGAADHPVNCRKSRIARRRGIYPHIVIDRCGHSTLLSLARRSVAQPGSASDLGSEGRRFESYRSDQGIKGLADANPFFFGALLSYCYHLEGTSVRSREMATFPTQPPEFVGRADWGGDNNYPPNDMIDAKPIAA